MIAIGLRRIAERRGGLVFTAVAYAGIVFTHLPLALLTSIFLIGPYAILHRRELRSFAAAIAAGIGLVAIYLVPALALGPFRDVDQLYRYDFLRTDYWSIYHPHLDNSFVLTIFVIVAVIVAAAEVAVIVPPVTCTAPTFWGNAPMLSVPPVTVRAPEPRLLAAAVELSVPALTVVPPV